MEWLLSLPRAIKRILSLTMDVAFLCLSFVASYFLTHSEQDGYGLTPLVIAFALALPVTLVIFVKLGLYRAVIRYMGQYALGAVMAGIVSSALVLGGAFYAMNVPVNASLIFVYSLLVLVTSGGVRLLARIALAYRSNRQKERVLIYGAGSSGRQLAQALMNGEQYHPVLFVDDDITLQRSTILGIPVAFPNQIRMLVKTYNIQRICLAMPSASRSRRREVLDALEDLPVPVQSIPGMSDLVNGSMRIDELQDVKIEDLLGRDAVAPDKQLMQTNITNKVVMVTGAGGSIGSELCRQILKCNPHTLVLFEQSEAALYDIDRTLRQQAGEDGLELNIVPLIGSVSDKARVFAAMNAFKVQTVYHAAAYKHVPLVEYNVIEGVRNNILGTLRTAEAAIEAGVGVFVLISTDKAVRPTSVMGASKRFAELVLQGLALLEHKTCFCMVRFGNVLGSSGSVVPLFREQILRGGPVTVTHKDIYRYFMTVTEAAQLVIQAGAMARGGDVFVLDMGEAVKIADLAKRMIHLMGLEVKDQNHPHGDIEIKYTGLRPGEKLYEELLVGTNVRKTAHSRILAADEISLSWPEIKILLERLEFSCNAYSVQSVIEVLQTAPIDFNCRTHNSDLIVDNLHVEFSDGADVEIKSDMPCNIPKKEWQQIA